MRPATRPRAPADFGPPSTLTFVHHIGTSALPLTVHGWVIARYDYGGNELQTGCTCTVLLVRESGGGFAYGLHREIRYPDGRLHAIPSEAGRSEHAGKVRDWMRTIRERALVEHRVFLLHAQEQADTALAAREAWPVG